MLNMGSDDQLRKFERTYLRHKLHFWLHNDNDKHYDAKPTRLHIRCHGSVLELASDLVSIMSSIPCYCSLHVIVWCNIGSWKTENNSRIVQSEPRKTMIRLIYSSECN